MIQRTWYRPFIAFACFGSLVLVLVFHSLTQHFNQDEEQYVAAGYLAQHLRLYVDFLYVQPPIYPLVLSKLLILFSAVSPFLVARLLSAALSIGSIVVFFDLALNLSKSRPVAYMLGLLFVTSPLMLLAYGSARNDIMPIFFGLCGVWLAMRVLDAEPAQSNHQLTLFLAGACMAFAVGAKVTAAFVPLTATLYFFARAKRFLLPIILGGAIGSLPIIYYLATAFNKFVYCTTIFNFTAPKEFFTDIGRADALTWPYRLKTMALALASDPGLVLATLFIVFAAFVAWRRGPGFLAAKQLLADRSFIIFCMIAVIPFIFLPNPSNRQYLQPAIPYVFLSCAVLYSMAQEIIEGRQMLLLAAMAVMVVALQVGRFVWEASQQMNRPLWTVTQVYDLSALVARYVKGGAVASLYPALVLDAGTPIYPQFATSVFFFRSGDHLSPKRVLELNGASPKTVAHLLDLKPPAAVFVGNTSEDKPLLNWARQHCYFEVSLSKWRGGPYDKSWTPRLLVRGRQQGLCSDS
jgi:Dolichyl-phosphate-mannose-protein mannosyltransferase